VSSRTGRSRSSSRRSNKAYADDRFDTYAMSRSPSGSAVWKPRVTDPADVGRLDVGDLRGENGRREDGQFGRGHPRAESAYTRFEDGAINIA